MSLIYWWPFTDNTVDKINGKTFTSTNWSFQSNGKIGNCFAPSWTDSNTISRQIYADNVSIPETFSVAVWVKNNNNFNSPRTYCPIQFSNGDCWISGANNKGWDFSHNSLRLIFNNGSNVSGSAGNAEVNWGYNPREFLGSWYHIAFTVNKTTRKAELFINGVSKGIKDLPSAVDTYGGTFKLKINWVQGWMLDGSLNDLRIYDHALSSAEVKEISQALVVHYTFNDTLSEPTTNLISNLHNLVNCTRYDNGVKIDWNTNSADTYFFIIPRETLISGDIYTISFWCDGVGDNDDVSFAMSNLGNTHKFFIHDGYNEFTFTMNDTIANGCFLDDINRVSGKIFTLINIQLEKKDHATPYTPTSRDGMLVNETGYSREAISINTNLTSDTFIGSHSMKFNGIGTSTQSYIDIGDITIDTNYMTFCVWCKWNSLQNWSRIFDFGKSTEGQDTDILLANNGTSTSLYLAGRTAGGGSFPDTNVGTISTGVWYFISAVINNKVAKVYIYKEDGTLQTKEFSINDLGDSVTFTNCYLGKSNWSNDSYFDGQIADFKIYTTALSSNDIKDLYKAKAYITDKGDIMCGEFIEDKTDTMVTEKGTFECKEVYEEIDSAYERLEYIQTSGTQYIKTGIQSHDNITKLNAHYYQLTYDPGQILFGCYDGVATMYFNYKELGIIEHRSHWMYTDLRTGAEWKENQDVKSTLVINGNNLILTNNGKTVTGVASMSKGSNSYEMLLGAYSAQGSAGYFFYCKLYNFQIEVDNVLVRNFIPCKRKSDNVLGLFDSVNKVFYTNAGSGTFGAGPSVTNNDASIYEDGHISGREIIEI